jgi:GGDEF domain-containing protein
VTDPHAASVPAARDPYPTVLEVGTTLAASLDPDEVVQAIAQQVGEALDVQWADINEYDPVARTMTYVAVWSEQSPAADLDHLGTVVSLDDRPERDAAIRKGDLLEAYLDDPDLDPSEREVMQKYDEKAVMEVPLVFGGEALGVLGVVEGRRHRRFTDEEKQLLRLLAGPAASALGNARLYRAQRAQERRLEALLDAGRALATSVDLDEVLADVARVAADLAGVAYTTVHEYRPHHDALVYRASFSREPAPDLVAADPLGTAYPLADWPGERAILAAAAAVEERISDRGLSPDRRAVMESWRQKTCLSLPLRAGEEAHGILRLTVVDVERRFTGEEVEVLEALADIASVAIHNARMFRVQDEESRRLLGLFELSRQLASTLDRPALAATLEDGVSRLLSDDVRAQVWLRDAEGRLVCGGGDEEAGGLARQALSSLRVAEAVAPDCSGVAVPLVVKDVTEGVLAVETDGYRRFTGAEREALQVLANQAAAMLENERLYRRAEQEAIRDGLTGLYNHRHFQERLRQEFRRARRYGTPLSLLMLDLDEFKLFNDEFGHQTGDEALREVGQLLFGATRRGVDLAARYGGEEFAVILPHTRVAGTPEEEEVAVEDDPGAPPAGAGALTVAERLRTAVADHVFPGHGGRRHARTTATVGVAELRPGEEVSDFVAAADGALYEGKRRGRDQVVARDG